VYVPASKDTVCPGEASLITLWIVELPCPARTLCVVAPASGQIASRNSASPLMHGMTTWFMVAGVLQVTAFVVCNSHNLPLLMTNSSSSRRGYDEFFSTFVKDLITRLLITRVEYPENRASDLRPVVIRLAHEGHGTPKRGRSAKP
jgi:hypothetical protein